MRVFALSSETLRVRLLDYGATLMSLEAPDRHGVRADVVLGFDAPQLYRQRHPYLGATVGRFANRIAGGGFVLDGTAYQLSLNEGRHHLHGGRQGFDRVVWQARQERDAVHFQHVSHDGDEGYPGTLSAQVSYALAGNVLVIDYQARSDRPTIVNLTNHAYFNLAGAGHVDAHCIRLAASRYVEVDAERIPTGALVAAAGDMDFNRVRTLGDTHVDHSYVLEGAIEAYDPASGRALRIRTTQPAVQFYTGDLLDGSVSGKGGRQYRARAGLCLEPQHFPDSPHHADFPSTVLRPGENYRHRTAYEFFVRR